MSTSTPAVTVSPASRKASKTPMFSSSVSRFMRSAIKNIPACTGSTWPSRMARMARRASSREMSLLISGPVAMRWITERMKALGPSGRSQGGASSIGIRRRAEGHRKGVVQA